jgi:uncharacterized membrane protein YjfL (UPF0719 family)
MDLTLFAIGVSKLLFGLFVGVVGITLSARLVKRFSGFESVDACLRGGNAAMGIILAGAIIAMGLMTQHAVTGTFGALDLVRHQADQLADVLWMLLYAALHIAAALLMGTAVLVFGIRSFMRLTRGIDEVAQIREGNLASALVLAAVTVVLALLAQQGLQTMLDALLPLPALGRDLVAPG